MYSSFQANFCFSYRLVWILIPQEIGITVGSTKNVNLHINMCQDSTTKTTKPFTPIKDRLEMKPIGGEKTDKNKSKKEGQ
jgi:hypothetical protein